MLTKPGASLASEPARRRSHLTVRARAVVRKGKAHLQYAVLPKRPSDVWLSLVSVRICEIENAVVTQSADLLFPSDFRHSFRSTAGTGSSETELTFQLAAISFACRSVQSTNRVCKPKRFAPLLVYSNVP